MIVHMLLEGVHEEVLARKIIQYCGHEPGIVYGQRGCRFIQEKAASFAFLATDQSAVLILTDFMDSGCGCPPDAYKRYIVSRRTVVPASFLCRFIVNEFESWLMADREGVASFLQIATNKVPLHPETVPDPKGAFVQLARGSRVSRLRDAIVPPPRHGGAVGPGYTMAIGELACNFWSPERAVSNASSLDRCILRLLDLHKSTQ